jgi:hypothetical protein
MNNQSKLFFYLALFNVLFAITLNTDCYLLPAKEVNEKFDYLSHEYHQSRGSESYTSYFVCKSGRKYKVPNDFYFDFKGDSSLIIKQTVVFQMPLSIASPSTRDYKWSNMEQIKGDMLFQVLMILFVSISLIVIIRRKTLLSSGVDILAVSVVFYMAFILTLI